MKPYKHKIIFSSKLEVIISKDRNKYLNEASIEKLKPFIPKIDINKNFDLLPFSANAAVVNGINLNDDGITTVTALAVYKDFINKYVNVEHDRGSIIGCILTAGFSEFGTNKPLTEEEVKDYKKPFNLTIGGIVWRLANEKVADFIEESSDPTSKNYLSVSISWEIGFEEEEFVLIKGNSRNTEDGQIVENTAEIDKIKKFSRAYGGTGNYEDYHVYRLIKGTDVLPLGIGVTEIPAANVKGILTANLESREDKTEEILNKLENIDKKFIENAENLKTAIENQVIAELLKQKTVNIDNTKEKVIASPKVVNINMKIDNIKSLTDENLKEAKASEIHDLFEKTLKEGSDKWVADKTANEKAIKELEEKNKTVLAEADKAKSEIEKLSKQLAELQESANKREKEEKFNQRMAKLDEIFELEKEDRAEIVADVKELDDAGFDKYQKKMSVLMKNKLKSESSASVADVVSDAIDKGKKDKAAVAATTSVELEGMEKFRKAFEVGKGIVISK